MAPLIARFALFILGVVLVGVGLSDNNDKERGSIVFAAGLICVGIAVALIELR